MRPQVSEATKDEVYFLNLQKLSNNEIGRRLDLHPMTVGNILRDKGCPSKILRPKIPDQLTPEVDPVNQVLMQSWNKAVRIEAVSIG